MYIWRFEVLRNESSFKLLSVSKLRGCCFCEEMLMECVKIYFWKLYFENEYFPVCRKIKVYRERR